MPWQQWWDRLRHRRAVAAGVTLGLVVPLAALWMLSGGPGHTSGDKDNDAARRTPQSVPDAAAPTDSASPNPEAVPVDPGQSGSPTVSDVAVPPIPAAGAVPLDGWKLTLPVDRGGSLSGTAAQVSAAVTAPWLTRNPDGSLAFWAPSSGAKTANSQHARTELVSTADWSFGTGVHTLTAQLSVDQVPGDNRDICVGQIHGGGPIKSIPFVMLHWRDGDIVVIVKTVLHGSSSHSIKLLTGVPLGARFSYVMTDEGNGSLTLTAAYNGQARQATTAVVPAFIGTDQRFQAGDYQQATGGSSPSDGGKATFYALALS